MMRQLAKKTIRGSVPELWFGSLVLRRAPLWRKAGITFIHIPKNAGTSFNEALYGRLMGHYTAAEASRWAGRTFRSLPSFALSRNPWSRVYSAYKYAQLGRVGAQNNTLQGSDRGVKMFRKMTFETFVTQWLSQTPLMRQDRIHWPQSRFVTNARSEIIVDYIGSVEAPSRALEFLHETGIKVSEVPHLNRHTDDREYREHYSEAMRAIVANLYSEDIERFEYSF